MAQGGRIKKDNGGIMNLGGMEKDYRTTGGFVPIGAYEKKDDVPGSYDPVIDAKLISMKGGEDTQLKNRNCKGTISWSQNINSGWSNKFFRYN